MSLPTDWSSKELAVGVVVSGATPFVQGAQNLIGVVTGNVSQTQIIPQPTAAAQTRLLVPLQPIVSAPFQFQATFDRTGYSITVNWNFYAQRNYVNVFNSQGVRVYTLPLIESPDDYDVNLNQGYFTTRMVFRASNQTFEIFG